MKGQSAGAAAVLGVCLLLVPGGRASAREIRVGVAVNRDRVVVQVERGTLEVKGRGEIEPLVGELVLAWPHPGGRADARPTFRIQVGAYASEEEAKRQAAALRGLLEEASAALDPETRTYRVRGGGFDNRDRALEALRTRVARSFADAFVVEETARRADGAFVLALAALDRRIDARSPAILRPAPGTFLLVDGVRYRGASSFRLGTSGLLNAIDIVDLEEYLRGVVPKEMGPAQYPELEALKAQAVAARTYALASLDGFPQEGYDLCATPRCQVYGGADAEQPLTDRAVAETRDLVLSAQGALVKAYFSATCGGHTENVENVFIGNPEASYLRGASCGPAAEEVYRLPAGGRVTLARAEDGSELAGAMVLLRGAELLDVIPTDAALRAPMPAAEARARVRAAARFAGRPAAADDGAAMGAHVTLGAFLEDVAAAFALAERAQVLLTDADVRALVRAPDVESLPEATRRTLAILALNRALPHFPDGKLDRTRVVSRGLVLAILGRLLESVGAPLSREGVVVRLEPGSLVWRRAGAEEVVALDAAAILLRQTGARLVPYGHGRLLAGDTVRLHGVSGPARGLVLLESESGADDRRARDSRWTVSLGQAELDAKVRESYAIGKLEDLKVLSRGPSGRPLELLLEGTEGTARVRGFAIKRLLGLKDDLFVVERVTAGDRSRTFRFIGRGWGHGVGLCQEGSYGMALRGRSFRDILHRYYPGAEVVAHPMRVGGDDRAAP